MIIDLQRRLHEAGRIRIGQQVPVGNTGKTRPAKLDTFRLTSPDKTLIERAANRYGGDVGQWTAPAGPQWEVITTTTSLPVIVPPSDLGFSQHYELWSGGGCLRRCNGRDATYNDNNTMVEGECLCDPDNRECSIHTRLSVMLRDLVGLGLWRLDTQGWNAALELQGAVEILQMAAGRGTMLPAQLRLEQRMVKRPGQQTRRFAVPVLDIEISPAQLLSGGVGVDRLDAGTVAIEPPRVNGSAPLTPVPDSVAEHPAGSIAEQIAPPPPPKRRGQVPIPATGVKPRTAKQASQPPPTPDEAHPDHPRQTCAEYENAKLAAELAEERDRPDDDWPHIEGSSGQSAAPLFPDNADEPDDDGVRMISAPQLKKLSILLKEAGFTDRQARHDFVAQAIGHGIESAKELTLDEASRVIDILENDRPGEGEIDE